MRRGLGLLDLFLREVVECNVDKGEGFFDFHFSFIIPSGKG